MKNIKNILGLIFYFMHLICGLILTLYLLYTDNLYYVIFMLCITFILVVSWYMFNDCLLLSFENSLLDKKNEYFDFTKYKVIELFGRKYYIFNHVLYSTYIYSTTIVFFIAIIKLITICNKKKFY